MYNKRRKKSKTEKNRQVKMADSEDHRQKNILLAKNLNDVKMNLQAKRKDIASLQTQLREERQQNEKMKMEQVSILNRIDTLKKQLDDTFIKNTIGYFHLLKKLDQMHQDSIQSIGDISMLSTSTATANSSQLMFLEKFKSFSESFGESFSTFDGGSNSTLNESSFDSFEIGLNSTFVTNHEENVDETDDVVEDLELNRTFLTEKQEPTPVNNSHEGSKSSPETNGRPLLCEKARNTNITVRRAKETPKVETLKMETPKLENRITKRRSHKNRKENRSDVGPLLKKMVLRSIKKIDYNESSFRRNN